MADDGARNAAKEPLAAQVVEVIRQRMNARADDLHRISLTGYSFEEWLNWEIFVACVQAGYTEVEPRPAYSKLSAVPTRLLGDVLVTHDGAQLLVEVGIVHDWTGNKWLHKLEMDRRKLATPFIRPVEALQVVVCASSSNLFNDPRWTDWMKRLSFATTPTLADYRIEMPRGTARLQAWDWTATAHGLG